MKKELISILDVDEPDYTLARKYNKTALPVLLEIANGKDPYLAAKAIYFASYINVPELDGFYSEILKLKEPIINIAIAGSLLITDKTNKASIAKELLQHNNEQVRFMALKSVSKLNLKTLKDDVEKMSKDDIDPDVKEFAKKIML